MTNKLCVKICGMRDPENIREVGALLPDYMGFIFYPSSPRYAGKDFQIPDDFPDSINRVGVFVNEPLESILNKAKHYAMSYIQLHGDEPVDQCLELKANGLNVIKVFSIGDHFDFSVLKPFKPVVDYFMFDTKGKYFGGNAQTFNWKILKDYDQEIPFFLGGGLNAENISGVSTLKSLNLFSIDLNSGVETEPGIKDVKRIKMCMEIMMRYE